MKKVLSILLTLAISFAFVTMAQARLVGDVNSDGTVTSLDALEVLQFAVGINTEINEKFADLNSDGNINSTDALTILTICVGSYDGDLEVEDELVTSYFNDKVSPILKTGKFKMTILTQDGEEIIPISTTFNGGNICVEMTVSGIKTRALIIGNKTYVVMPDLRIYMESEAVDVGGFGVGSTSGTYVKSEYVTIDGKKYVCETFKNENGSLNNYYFLDGEWKILEEVTASGESSRILIESLTASIDESIFSLKGFVEIK